MIILAIDTSGRIASAAIFREGVVAAYAERDAMLDHSSALLGLCEQVLNQSQTDIGEVDLFAAASGPGSFTGVRIGVAAIKGFGWTRSKPCAGVSTLLAVACGSAQEGRVCCRIAARQGEFYYAFFERRGTYVYRLSDDAVATADVIEAQAAQLDITDYIDDGQNAKSVAQAALQMAGDGELSTCHEIVPSYLRKPQAQRILEEKTASDNSQC